MKKESEKKCWTDFYNKFWRNAGIILLLAAITMVSQIEISAQSPCADYFQGYDVSRIGAEFSTPGENYTNNSAYYSIARDGSPTHSIYIETQSPADTIFRAYLNGVEMGSLSKIGTTTTWSWTDFTSDWIGRVGDILTITKNGQSFISTTYSRPIYDYEENFGYAEGIPNANIFYCSSVYGYTLLPSSSNPRSFRISFARLHAPQPITRITLNEPSNQPDVPGNEIFSYSFVNLTIPQYPGWYRVGMGSGTNNPLSLTENQYALLRQGLLKLIIYTAQHPNGYRQVPIATQAVNSSGDFEGDGMADLAVYRPSEQKWFTQYSSDNSIQTLVFGQPNDKILVGDYDADRKLDRTTFQTDDPNYPGRGVWRIFRSSDESLQEIQWGLRDDIPLTLEIDRNNTSDIAVFRPSSGIWYIHRMGDIIKPLTNEFHGESDLAIQWGTVGDKPLTGDFNADGIDELIAFRPTEGNWYIYDYANRNYRIEHWGMSGDIAMAKDFDGDLKFDLAVYRPSEGNWYIRNSIDNSITIRRFGLSEDIPVPADFDKDSVADIAVFRPSDGTWYVLKSSDNSFFATRFGMNGDIPAFGAR